MALCHSEPSRVSLFQCQIKYWSILSSGDLGKCYQIIPFPYVHMSSHAHIHTCVYILNYTYTYIYTYYIYTPCTFFSFTTSGSKVWKLHLLWWRCWRPSTMGWLRPLPGLRPSRMFIKIMEMWMFMCACVYLCLYIYVCVREREGVCVYIYRCMYLCRSMLFCLCVVLSIDLSRLPWNYLFIHSFKIEIQGFWTPPYPFRVQILGRKTFWKTPDACESHALG